MKRRVQTFLLRGPAGQLEALWEQPEPAGNDLVGLVCHPHPLYGGTMHNKVVHHTAQALQELGLAVLRFNFRGVGQSQGKHDQGRGEADDVRAALDWLAGERPQAGMVVAGFSFGAWVGLRVGCADERVRALVGVGLPANDSDFAYLAGCPKPKLFVQGTRDPHGSRASVEQAVAQVAPPKELVWVNGADHFFGGHLQQLRAAIRERLPALMGSAPASGPVL